MRAIWSRAHRDVHDFFGKDTTVIALSHADIARLLADVGRSTETHKGAYVVPRDPARPLSGANAMLVGPSARRFLVTRWQSVSCPEAYARAIALLSDDLLI